MLFTARDTIATRHSIKTNITKFTQLEFTYVLTVYLGKHAWQYLTFRVPVYSYEEFNCQKFLQLNHCWVLVLEQQS